MRAAVLLLALDEEADAAGELADRLEPSLDRPKPRQQLALVVRRTSRVQAAVADVGLVGRRRPELVGHGGLDVVVLDEVQRPRSSADLADHQRRSPVELDDLDLGSQRPQSLRRPVGGAEQGIDGALLRREPAVLDELVGPGVEAGVDQRVEGGEVGHVLSRSAVATGDDLDAVPVMRLAEGSLAVFLAVDPVLDVETFEGGADRRGRRTGHPVRTPTGRGRRTASWRSVRRR
jgi:hypothetical protein